MKLLRSMDDQISKAEDYFTSISKKKRLLLLVAIWSLLFVPSIIHHSYVLRDEHYSFYPENASPEGFDPSGWEVDTYPVDLESSSGDGFLTYPVSEGEKLDFRWIWYKNEGKDAHIGSVNIIYKMDGGEKKLLNLKAVSSSSEKEIWGGNKTFTDSGELSFYFRVEKTDIPIFQKRASLILDGENPYEETRTGPPPLINFLFIPPALLSPAVSVGGAFLSFNVYFALFVLLDSFMIYKCLEELDEVKGYIASLIFLMNPVTIFTFHQDEPIIAFLILVPLYFLIKDHNSSFSISAGVGTVVKVWTGFWLPVILFLRSKKKYLYLAMSVGVGIGLLLFFRVIWGPKVLWFLYFYGGGAARANIGGISFWNSAIGLLGISESVFPSTLLLGVIGLIELIILWIGRRRGWSPVAAFTSFFALFLALYPKIHWEYILLLLPTLAIISVYDRKHIILFYFITFSAGLSMRFLTFGGEFKIVSLIFSIMMSFSLVYIAYDFYKKDGQIKNMDYEIIDRDDR